MRTAAIDPDHRYLLVLDHDDEGDIQELITVICEGRPLGARSGCGQDQGGAS